MRGGSFYVEVVAIDAQEGVGDHEGGALVAIEEGLIAGQRFE